ncbi:MAG: 6,7-dimethyl-8-ribityllumazine synthase [Planctomycetes bacterium]|nr:6,7-dimethyl-8-ribityllumazine synthase [Planctomycetota bacterium]
MQSGKYQAVICRGCVIRGQTPHFEYLAGTVSKDLSLVGLDTGVSITFGVITSESLEQAAERAGSKACNNGAEAAPAAIDMASLLEKL